MATVIYLIQYLNFLDSIGDVGSGVILLVLSLVMLCGCLIGLVKLLNSILGEKVKDIISTFVNKAQSTWSIIRNFLGSKKQSLLMYTCIALYGSRFQYHDLK